MDSLDIIREVSSADNCTVGDAELVRRTLGCSHKLEHNKVIFLFEKLRQLINFWDIDAVPEYRVCRNVTSGSMRKKLFNKKPCQ